MSYTNSGLGGPAVDRWREAAAGHCYGQEIDDCVEGKSVDHPLCSAWMAADAEDEDGAQSVFDAMPYCSERPPWHLLGLAAGGGLVLGVMLVLAVR